MVVDAQLILYKCYSVIKGLDHFNSGQLQNLFFRSVKKTKRDFEDETGHNVQKVILAWDIGPYHRSNMVGSYKGDREHLTEESLNIDEDEVIFSIQDIIHYIPVGMNHDDVMVDEITAGLDEDTLLRLKREKVRTEKIRIQKELDKKEQFNNAKYNIITNFDKIGLPSCSKKGYEADDWAYIISRNAELAENERVLVVSVDSDWHYFVDDRTDYWQYKRMELHTVETLRETITGNANSELDVFKYKSYMDALAGNHNNLEGCITPEADKISWLDIIPLIESNGPDEYVKDKVLFSQQLSTFNITLFPEFDKVISSLYYLDKSGYLPDDVEYAKDPFYLGIPVPLSEYKQLKSTLNHTLFNDGITS